MHVQKQSLETVWAETTRWSPLAPTPAPSCFREVLFYTVFLSLQEQRTAMLSMSYHGHSMLFSLSSMTNKYIIHGRNLKSLLNRNKQTTIESDPPATSFLANCCHRDDARGRVHFGRCTHVKGRRSTLCEASPAGQRDGTRKESA